MSYGYFEGLSWSAWIVAAVYTNAVILFLWLRILPDRLALAVYAGPLLFVFVGFIEAADKGILVGRGFNGILNYAAGLFVVGAATSLFGGILLGSFLSFLEDRDKSKSP